MSGHSHFRSIKHKKELEDRKRGQIFSKIARLITIAAKNGSDPNKNSALRQALEEAKKVNMPKENIERAIKRGTGELKEEAELFEVSYEAIGPEGEMAILEGITDNKNRALGEVKNILQRYGWKLADQGAVKWLFEKRAYLTINLESETIKNKSKDELELFLIELGAQDLIYHDNFLDIIINPEDLEAFKEKLKSQNIEIVEENIGLYAKNSIEVKEEKKEHYQNLFEDLLDTDTVQNIYSNLNL
jgi:YebC/PmpR family DNA-binding regulatory protein